MRVLSEAELCWWKDRWWAEEEYLRICEHAKISIAEVDAKIERVARVFNESWGRKYGLHPVHYWLFMKGAMPLQFLFGLGSDLECVEKCDGLRGVIKSLREPSGFESTLFELQLGAILAKEGHRISFHPRLPNGHEADFVAEKGEQRVFFEVKKLRESQSRVAASDFSTRLNWVLMDLTRPPNGPLTDYYFTVELNPELLSSLGAGPEVDDHVINGMLATVKEDVVSRVRGGELSFDISGVGFFAFDPAKGVAGSSITFQQRGVGTELKRIIQSHLTRAVKQLHTEFPGIIIVQSASELDDPLTQRVVAGMLSSLGSKAAHVSAVMFLPLLHALPRQWALFNAFAVANPNATVNATKLGAFQDLAQGLLQHRVATPNEY